MLILNILKIHMEHLLLERKKNMEQNYDYIIKESIEHHQYIGQMIENNFMKLRTMDKVMLY